MLLGTPATGGLVALLASVPGSAFATASVAKAIWELPWMPVPSSQGPGSWLWSLPLAGSQLLLNAGQDHHPPPHRWGQECTGGKSSS